MRKYLLVVLIVAATAWGIRELSRVAERRVTAWRDETIGSLLDSFGYRLTYTDVSFSLTGVIEFRDLAVSAAELPAEPLALVRRLRVRFSLPQLVSIRDPLSALREVQVADSEFAFDLRQEQGLHRLVGVLVGAAGTGSASATLPPIDLRGESLGVVIAADETRILLQGLDFRVRTGEPLRISATAMASAEIAPASGASLLGSTVSADVRIDGSAATDLGSGEATVHVAEVTSEALTVRPVTLRVTLSDERLQVTKVQDPVPLDIQFVHDLPSRRSELRFAADSLDLADLIHFDDLGGVPAALATAELTGSATWARHPQHGISYSGTLAAVISPGHGTPAADVVLSASGDFTRVSVTQLEARTDDFRMHFAGDLDLDSLAPRGVVAVETMLLLPARQPLQARFTVRPDEDRVELAAMELQVGDVSVRGLTAQVLPDAANARRFRFQARGEIEQDAANSISAAGTLDLSAGAALDFSTRLAGVEAAVLYGLAAAAEQRQPWLAASLDPLLVSADVAGSTDFSTVAVERSVVELVDERDRTSQARVHLDSDRGVWFVEGAFLQWNDLHLHADARVTPAAGGELEAILDLSVNDQPYEVFVTYRPDTGLTAKSSQFELTADYADDGATTFRASATALPISVAPSLSPMRVTATLDGSVTPAAGWSFTGRDVQIDGVPFLEQRGAQVMFGFRASQTGASLEPITLRVDGMQLVGSGQVNYGTVGAPVAGSLTLYDVGERERYELAIEIDQGKLSADAEFRGLPLERIGEFPVSGRLRGRLTASGPPHELSWSATVATEDAKLDDEAVSLAADIAFASGNLTVEGVAFELLSHRVRDGSMTYDRNNGGVRFEADFETAFLGDAMSGQLTLSAEGLHVSDSSGVRDALAEGVHATLRAGELQVAGVSVDPWQVVLFTASTGPQSAASPVAPTLERSSAQLPFTGSDHEFVVRFSGGPGEDVEGFISTSGQFQIRVRGQTYPLRATVTGSYSDGRITADMDLEDVDAQMIGAALGSAPVSLESGRVSGSVRVAGALSDPDFWGTIRLTGATLTSELTPQVMGPLTVELALAEKRATISRFVSESDVMLPLALSGDVTLERYMPATYRLELIAPRPHGLEIDYRIGPVRFDGNVTGEIAVTGDGETVAVRGEARVERGDISLAELSEEMLAAALVDVDLVLTTGRSVEFTWPRPEFPILRATLAPDERVRIRYDGAAGGLSVDGDVGVRSGDLFYFDRQFRLREGSIQLAESERGFDPRLQLRAETRERDAAGDPVRITLSADTTLSELSPETIRLSSDPPRSTVALDALVRDPIAAQNDRIAGGAGSAAAAFSGDLWAQTALFRPLERALRQALGVDMVGIRTPFVQNIVYDGLVSGSPFTVGNPFDDTSFSVGKYLADDLFLAMLVRIDTSADLPSQAPTLVSDVELNLEWDTPFFMLEWSFLPRDANTLFLTDVAVTLSWRWRY